MEYGITSKPSTSGNPTSNMILEQINQVLGNLVRTCNSTHTYVDKDDPWSGILAAAVFAICSTSNMLNGYSTGKLGFVHDIILPIKHKVGWEIIRQQKQAQINKQNIRENRK